jgi:hypothetical protein
VTSPIPLADNAGGLGRRQMDLRAVLEHRTVEIATRPIKRHAHPPCCGHRLRWPRKRREGREARAGRSGIDHGLAGRGIADRNRLHHRHGISTQAADRDLIADPDGPEQRRTEMRRHMDFGAIGEDDAIDIAARGEAKGRHLAGDLRPLCRIRPRCKPRRWGRRHAGRWGLGASGAKAEQQAGCDQNTQA